ncbi:multicopper oxidase [Sphaerobolus stellatus SS14]|uniref:Multicopper oxidase n=1 Tax=Sphaerobolus stellatus (strain SS14) TaxID=990650 RepID=A0A0C9VC95_SPHS4|nr:multicopper oxidase [Sphaerobolus stellatus SS14]
MAILVKLSLLALLPFFIANAAVVTQTFTLGAQNLSPDGFQRTTAVVNGQFPGPFLKANKGDNIFVNAVNNLNDDNICKSISIVLISTSNDGPSFVTQCPIAPNHTYAYQLALGNQAGTYHSHLSTQYVDGIRGPMVIYDPEDPHLSLYDVDNDDTVITLADWYHTPAMISTNEWIVQHLTSEPVPDSELINGIRRYSSGPAVKRARINVSKSTRYRFRVASLSAEGVFTFAIDNHNMTNVEDDGISTVPYTVDAIQIFPGQRYSVVVNADKAVDNYCTIRASQTVLGSPTSKDNPRFNGTDTYAVLHYDEASNNEPTTPQPGLNLPARLSAFNESSLQPLVNPAPSGGSGPADVSFNFIFGPDPKIYSSFDFGTNEQTIVLPFNSTIEVVFIEVTGHPFHLHGHYFSVIQSAAGGLSNFVNPPRRDVVATGGTTTPTRIRFRTDNPVYSLPYRLALGGWFGHRIRRRSKRDSKRSSIRSAERSLGPTLLDL